MKLEANMKIICKDHPEWGVWRVLKHYASNTWEIRGTSGDRTLDQAEADKFWSNDIKRTCFCGESGCDGNPKKEG